jgi:hypothetical protein
MDPRLAPPYNHETEKRLEPHAHATCRHDSKFGVQFDQALDQPADGSALPPGELIAKYLLLKLNPTTSQRINQYPYQ